MDSTPAIPIMLIDLDIIPNDVRAIVATPRRRGLTRSIELMMRDDINHHLRRVLHHSLGGRKLVINVCKPKRPPRIAEFANEVTRPHRNPSRLPQIAAATRIGDE